MIAIYIWIILVTVLAVYSAIGVYQNQQEIKILTDFTEWLINDARSNYQLIRMLIDQEGGAAE